MGLEGVTATSASGASVNLRYSWSRTSASSWRACSRSIVALISASVWMTRLLIFSLEASTKACTCQRASSCSFSAASRSSASWVADRLARRGVLRLGGLVLGLELREDRLPGLAVLRLRGFDLGVPDLLRLLERGLQLILDRLGVEALAALGLRLGAGTLGRQLLQGVEGVDLFLDQG